MAPGIRTEKKQVDLPPTGQRNADPITDEPGSHPIETGIGAAVGGAVTGMAVGSVAGPIATAVGAAVGAVAGGYAGKGVGEMIDPTTDDNWLRENFKSRPYVKAGDQFDDYAPAFRYGGLAESKFGDAGIDLMDEQLRRDWEAHHDSDMPWRGPAPPSKTPTTAPFKSAAAATSRILATTCPKTDARRNHNITTFHAPSRFAAHPRRSGPSTQFKGVRYLIFVITKLSDTAI